ncbi:MAG: hypothetical protein LQ337_007954 [Flavoplaca oasis]|nr:MAG: hypothetical protein LQ337_007954 [Flavoplaca oasis]
MPPKSVQRRHRHTAEDWEGIKDAFVLLYILQDKSLESVMEIMESESGFKASLRQYKNKIKEWALKKNIKASDAQSLVAKEQQRARERGVGTLFSIGDATLDHDRWERLVSRINNGQTTPLAITYRTPETVLDAGSPVLEGHELFASKIRHHYDTIADIVTIDVLHELNSFTDKTASQGLHEIHAQIFRKVHAQGPLTEDEFRPFQIEADGFVCKSCHRLRLPNTESGLGCDSVQGEEEEEELVFDNGSTDLDKQEDAEAHQFDPYLSDEALATSDDTDEGGYAR